MTGLHGPAVRFHEYGDVSVLKVEDTEVRSPARGEVTVRVRAAGINPGEAAIRRGDLHHLWPARFPSGQGSDLAGEIVAVGADVEGMCIGDPVMGWTWERASHAAYVNVPTSQLITRPDALSWEVAGSLYVIACATHAAVTAIAPSAGDVVVVSAAAGGVGSLAVQYLRWLGVHTIGIASARNHPWLADHGVRPVSYGEGMADSIRTIAPSGVDAFIDLYGPEYVDLAIDLGVPADRIETIISFQRAAEVGALSVGSESSSSLAVLQEFTDLVSTGQLDIPIAERFPLTDVQSAFRHLEKRHTHGKIVLRP
ncbi:NADP-dependent oxidoreductase [Leifsonia sp. RAF41]|uniref:NADP-dependent oxidoreductase n=1 Tax=Leifsonia sp. RAF41 TaxID=3233056 RepID=UPI003F9BCCCE